MPDPYSLLIGALSLLLAASYFGFSIGSVLVHPIGVPSNLQDRGYSSESFTRLVLHEIDNLHFTAGAEYVGTSVDALPEDMKVSVAGTDFSMTQLGIVLARRTGSIKYEFAGDVVERDGKLVLLLNGHGPAGRISFAETDPSNDPYALVRDAARDIIAVTDPYGAMKLQFEADKATRDFSKTLAMVHDLLPMIPVQRHHLLYNIAGRAFEFSGHPEQAEAAFRKAIEVNPRYPISYSNLAITMRKLGRTDEADALDRKALELNPHFFMFYGRNAEAYRMAGSWDRCVANFSRFLHYVTDDAKSYYDYSFCLKGLGRQEESERALARAVVLNPELALLSSAQRAPAPAAATPAKTPP